MGKDESYRRKMLSTGSIKGMKEKDYYEQNEI
jgi:hypothetical protein